MDLVRQTGVFNPMPFNNNVAVIGVGALGSALALQLAKLGIEGLRLYDGDTVEPHNLPNQCLYGPGDVGRNKAEAAAERLRLLTGNSHHGRDAVDLTAPRHRRDRLRYPVVFTCVDSMAARDKLWKNHVFANGHTALYGEARMGARHGAAYLFNSQDALHAAEYEQELYSDDDVTHDRAACGAILSIGATAMTLACALTWMLISASNGTPHPNEIMVRCEPWSTPSSRVFPQSL